MTASGLRDATGKSPALERSAVCQSPRRSPDQYWAADTPIGTKTSNRKMITNFLKGAKGGVNVWGGIPHIVRLVGCASSAPQPFEDCAKLTHLRLSTSPPQYH